MAEYIIRQSIIQQQIGERETAMGGMVPEYRTVGSINDTREQEVFVACVNAMAGHNPEALAEFEAAVDKHIKNHDCAALTFGMESCGTCTFCAMVKALEKFRGKR